MKCFLLSRDLMFTSQATGAANAAGCETQTVGNLDQVTADEPHVVVLDLTLPGLDIASTVEGLKKNSAKVIAVGPHVHEANLAAAQEAGCDFVITKGQASRELGAFIGQAINSG